MRENPPPPLENEFEHHSYAYEDRKCLMGRGKLTLPNGRVTNIQAVLGKGHASTAYQADDGWVYIVTREDSQDPAKQVLSEIVRDRIDWSEPFAKHIPRIEFVGHLGDKHDITRMHPYFKLKAGSVAKKIARQLRNELDKARQNVPYNRNRGSVYYQASEYMIDNIKNNINIPETVVDAIEFLRDCLTDYDDAWQFEFPDRNLAIDEHDNLILLDVFFKR